MMSFDRHFVGGTSISGRHLIKILAEGMKPKEKKLREKIKEMIKRFLFGNPQ